MSSAVKSLRASDITINSYKVNKQFTYESSSLYENEITVYKGYYDSGSALDQLLQEQINYFSIKQLYYSGYDTGSVNNTSGSYYNNFEQSTASSGSFEYEIRNFPIEQRSEIRVISIPQNLYGERLKPKHFILQSNSNEYYIVDDGNGNLYDIVDLSGPYVVDGYIDENYFDGVNMQELPHVGNIIYAHGIAIITNPEYLYIFPNDCILAGGTAQYTPNQCNIEGLLAYYIPVSPSPTPSVTPSITPTSTPSISISNTPSITPSATPSISPTRTPSVTPSVTPSISPTRTPSITPSTTPNTSPNPSPTDFVFLGTVDVKSTVSLSCGTFSTDVSYFLDTNTPTTGRYVYTNLPFTTGNRFTSVGGFITFRRVSPTYSSQIYTVGINSSGLITSVTLCNPYDGGTGGGGCPTPDMLIMIGENKWITAGELNVGDTVYTIHQYTNEWGYYEVTQKELQLQPVMEVKIDGKILTVSQTHKFLTESGKYTTLSELKVGDKLQTINGIKDIESLEYIGDKIIVKLEIEDAHTYVVEGVISHNLKEKTQSEDPL